MTPIAVITLRAGQPHLAIVLAWLILLSPAQSAETNRESSGICFHVGMAKVCFRNVNRNDAAASYRIFLETSGRQHGHNFKAQTQVFDDTSTFEAALQQGPMHMAVMEAWQFLVMDIHQKMKPYFVVAERGGSAGSI